jgi:histidinol-phosphate/aromatic aminotransferase/cobyric acid decarboxylase-like protein
LDASLRISVGTPADNDALLAALDAALAEAPLRAAPSTTA